MDLPSIESYRDYRAFLRDWFVARKASDPRFSHRRFAARAGFTSTALVPLIVQGKRRLTARYIDGFCRALGLDARRSEIFRKVVEFSHASTDEDRRRLEIELAGLDRKGPRKLGVDRLRFHESWIHAALHHALACLDVADDLSEVRRFLSPSPSADDLRRSLVLLRDLGLVRRDARGFWKPSESNLLAEDGIGPWVVRGFRDQMAEIGRTAHERFPQERWKSATETLAVGAAAAERIRKRLDDFRREVVEIAVSDPDAPEEILQLNMLLFPLSNEVPR